MAMWRYGGLLALCSGLAACGPLPVGDESDAKAPSPDRIGPDASGSDATTAVFPVAPDDAAAPDATAGLGQGDAPPVDAPSADRGEAGLDLDAAVGDDASLTNANSESSTDSGSDAADGSAACAAVEAAAPQPWCVEGGACVPTTECHVGALDCIALTCTDTGASVPDGTACSSGTCQSGTCLQSCTVADDCKVSSCMYGACTADSRSGTTYCASTEYQLEGDGVSCGPHQVCRVGVCITGCVSNSDCGDNERCDNPGYTCDRGSGSNGCPQYTFRCVADPCWSFGAQKPEGTVCTATACSSGAFGGPGVCDNGSCTAPLWNQWPSAFEFVPFDEAGVVEGKVAMFTALASPDLATDLSASVDWGDGVTSTGTVSAGDGYDTGSLVVRGVHTYAPTTAFASGTVTITHTASGAQLITSFTALPAKNATVYTLASASALASLAVGPDGNLWYASGSNFANISLTGAASSAYPFSTGQQAPATGAIAAGPDGKLWIPVVCEASQPNCSEGVVRVAVDFTMDAAIPLGGLGSFIAAGPDGNMWAVEEEPNAIARISPSGSVMEFAAPTADLLYGVTAGSDGNLWFGWFGAVTGQTAAVGQIGRITPQGAIDTFVIPSGNECSKVTLGPDGNVWFLAGLGGSSHPDTIGKVTPDGTITEFPLPSIVDQPRGPAVGPDGALWFTSHTQPIVGRVTTSGEIRLFALVESPVPPESLAEFNDVTAAPDGTLWLAGGPGVERIVP